MLSISASYYDDTFFLVCFIVELLSNLKYFAWNIIVPHKHFQLEILAAKHNYNRKFNSRARKTFCVSLRFNSYQATKTKKEPLLAQK